MSADLEALRAEFQRRCDGLNPDDRLVIEVWRVKVDEGLSWEAAGKLVGLPGRRFKAALKRALERVNDGYKRAVPTKRAKR